MRGRTRSVWSTNVMGSVLWIVTKDLNKDEKYKIRLNATIINKIDGKDWFYFRNETWYVCVMYGNQFGLRIMEKSGILQPE